MSNERAVERSEDLGVTDRAYREGRRFRVVREGAALEHGAVGRYGGRVELPVGSVVTFRGWRSNLDGDIAPIWGEIDGQPVRGIVGVLDKTPFAHFVPCVWITCHRLRLSDGEWLLEKTLGPDPRYLVPINERGEPEAG